MDSEISFERSLRASVLCGERYSIRRLGGPFPKGRLDLAAAGGRNPEGSRNGTQRVHFARGANLGQNGGGHQMQRRHDLNVSF